MAFAHLHTHTEYSLLDGSNRVKEYVSRVKELGMTAAAITDHGVMFGVIEFYEEALKQGIKPVIGCEVYVAPGSRFDKELSPDGSKYNHLVLLAENNEGYRNLMKIVSIGFLEGYYYKPRVDKEVLRRYHEGIIALSACLAGEIPRYIENGQVEAAINSAKEYDEIFGHGNFFLELQDHGIDMQTTVNMELLSISSKLGIPMVCTNDIHYTYAEDEESHDVLLCIQTGKKLSDEDRMRYEGGQYYVKSEEEMRKLFPYAAEAIENTQKIADRCNVSFTFGETKLPRFDVPEGYDAWSYLNKLCLEGLKNRYPSDFENHTERLEYELNTIKTMGFVEYFLIVWDFINYAKNKGIMVGPGRGSAAGSLVAYCLKITDIDPIKYNLIFERFLNPERVTMPDIDVDFADERRQEVIDYVSEKYGHDSVVQIVTFGSLQARAALKDVGRVMDIRLDLVNRLTKMIPEELGITIEKALQKNPELKELYDSDEEIRQLVDMSMKLEGLPRHSSTHASGVVICERAADELVPLCNINGGAPMAQFDMVTLERLGLLKMDFLGLRTQTVIQNAVINVEKSTGKALDIGKIDFDDKKVLSYVASGKTDGVFQLESAGMKNFMKELKPESLEDLIAGISLYRPGPMDFIPQYIAGKNNPKMVKYACRELEHILEPTYGCIVYQEQVMQIVRDLGGYTMGRSDNVRRAMSKKKLAVMEKEREIFINGNESVPGCVKNGIDSKVASDIYDTMIDFAKYAFNKSHAACYAVVAYQTAFLKYYYPAEYMASLLTSVLGNFSKMSGYILSCRNMGIQVLPPHINEGFSDFAVTAEGIRYALSAVKGVGLGIVQSIVSERELNGPYRNLQDFITRCHDKGINKKSIENLIKVGAFDSLGGTRKQYMSVYNDIFDHIHLENKHNYDGQMSLFDMIDEEEKEAYNIPLPSVGEYDKEVLLSFEKEMLGVYVSGHPLDDYKELWNKRISTRTTDFILDEEYNGTVVRDGEKVTVAGLVLEKKIKYTKNNDVMAFVTLEDLVGTLEIIAFPKAYRRFSDLLSEDNRIVISGRVSTEDNKDAKLIMEDAKPFTDINKSMWLQFGDEEDYKEKISTVMTIMEGSDGNDSVMVYIRDTKKVIKLPANKRVDANKELCEVLEKLLGEANVRVVY